MKIKGFIALSSVLIMSAIFLSISISMASFAISRSDTGVALYEKDKAHMLAQGCLEYALLELERTLDYEGNEGILIGDSSCEIAVIQGSGNQDRTIQVEGTFGAHTYRIEVVVGEVSPEVLLASYERIIEPN